MVTAGSELALGPSVPFSEGDFLNDVGQWFDVSPDGERFLLLQSLQHPTGNRLNVVMNWFDEVRRQARQDSNLQPPVLETGAAVPLRTARVGPV